MEIKQYDIWLADLNPTTRTAPGKTRPIVVIQTDLLNDVHLSTLICPITTNVKYFNRVIMGTFIRFTA